MSRLALYSIALAGIAAQVVHAADTASRATDLLRSRPIVFEPNVGQWDSKVKFSARTSDYRVLLSARGVELAAPTPPGEPRHTVSISPLHANPKAELSGDVEVPFRTSYFLGRKDHWRPKVANYSRVRYRSVYPGIDLVYYGSSRDLEYDFIVRPGADPDRIRLKFQGIKSMAVDSAGNLVVDTGVGRLVQRRPVVYQEDPGSGRREVRGKFSLLAKNVIGFQLESYDRSRALTIDPVLTYSTLIGGSGADRVTAVAVDAAGIVYVTGYVSALDMANVTTAFPTTSLGNVDIFVAKIDPNASSAAALKYFTYIGGSGADIPTAIALDRFGNIHLTGSTSSTDFPLAGSGPQNSLNNGVLGEFTQNLDAFVVKINPSESGLDALYYSTYLGGAAADIGNDIAVDAQGAIYVIGSTRSQKVTDSSGVESDPKQGFPVTDDAYQKIRFGNSDAFITKLNPALSPSLIHSTYLGGETTDEGRAIAVSPSGLVYIAGSTFAAGLPEAGKAYSTVPGGNGDLFVGQMDLTKFGESTLLYMSFLGGSGLDVLTKMKLDSQSRVLLTGYTLSPDFPVTPDAFQPQLKGFANTFLTRLDLTASPRAAQLSYSTFLGGSNGEVPYGMDLDAAGAVYLTGYTLSTDFPVTPDALQTTAGGGIDVFVSKLKLPDSSPSALLYSTYLGQTGVNVGYAIAASPDGKKIYVGGQTGAVNIGVTDNAFQAAYGGGASDGFLLVLGNPAQ